MIEKNIPKQNFVILDNNVLKDNSLSIGARMFYALLQSFPKQWQVNLKHIAEILNVSEASVRKYRNELVSAGVLKYHQEVDDKGRFNGKMIYTFLHINIEQEDRASESPKAIEFSPIAKKPANGESYTHNNIEYINNINSKEPNQKLLFLVLTSLKNFEDKSKSPPKYRQSLPQECFTEQERQSFKAFIAYRKERGFLAKSTIDSIIRDFETLKKANADIQACVDLCINRSWSGLLKANEALKRYATFKKPLRAIDKLTI